MTDTSSWPPYIDTAWRALSWHKDHHRLEAFRARWGGLTPDALARAVQEGEGEEKLFAIVALGGAKLPQSRTLLLPLLHSAIPEERWASALRLGELGEQEALPALCELLTANLRTALQDFKTSNYDLADDWRSGAPILLEKLGNPAAIPALRTALFHLVQLLEQTTLSEDALSEYARQEVSWEAAQWKDYPHLRAALAPEPPATARYVIGPEGEVRIESILRSQDELHQASMRYNLTGYQDLVIFALGRLGALGSLTGVPAAEPFLHVWMVQLLMGTMYGRYISSDVGVQWLSAPLNDEIRQRLLHDYGLTTQEQDRAIRLYLWTKSDTPFLRYPAAR